MKRIILAALVGVLIGDGKRYLDPLIKKLIGESIQRYRH